MQATAADSKIECNIKYCTLPVLHCHIPELAVVEGHHFDHQLNQDTMQDHLCLHTQTWPK
jgi:hypothetical protein